MVARINTGKSIKKALNYNEKKLQQKEAVCIHVNNFLKDVVAMNFYDKLKTFEKYTSLNDQAKTNTVHISLNFDPSEKLSNEKLTAIADDYMTRIGFAKQPYLVYRHHDAGHPHIHILSTNIQKDGARISMHNLGRNQSETARKAIEIEFNLVKAESKKLQAVEQLRPVEADKIGSGKQLAKAAISRVLYAVLTHYKYSSLPELNAILGLYNVKAERCGLDSQTYKHDGLQYRILDNNGKSVGTPIKASLFPMKPTLKNLSAYFSKNEGLKDPHRQELKTVIDVTLQQHLDMDIKILQGSLQKQGVSLVLRQNEEGLIYGLTYVDHNTKIVFNGSDLGKEYSAKGIQDRLQKSEFNRSESTTLYQYQPATPLGSKTPRQTAITNDVLNNFERMNLTQQTSNNTEALEALLKPEFISDAVPYPLKKTKRKRTKKRLRL